MYNILDTICLVQMSVQMSVQYILDTICLVQMSVQYTWHYMFSSNECTIYLTLYLVQISSNECTIYLTVYV